MKFDIDYLKNVIMNDEAPGNNSARLAAFKRASSIADPSVDLYQNAFKSHL